MQYWITVCNLSGWKVHFITLQLEFFNFLSLSSEKPGCFAILAVKLDINLKKPFFFLEERTTGFLAFALVSTCFNHSHLSPGCFSCMHSLQKQIPSHCFMDFFCLPSAGFSTHTSPSACLHHLSSVTRIISAYSQWQGFKGCKILSLAHCSRGGHPSAMEKGYA